MAQIIKITISTNSTQRFLTSKEHSIKAGYVLSCYFKTHMPNGKLCFGIINHAQDFKYVCTGESANLCYVVRSLRLDNASY